MPRRPAPDQLEAYRKQQVEIARKIKAAETKRREREKADDLRRKLVLGAAALDYFAQPDQLPNRAAFLQAMFRGRKMSASDKALFRSLEMPSASNGGTRGDIAVTDANACGK